MNTFLGIVSGHFKEFTKYICQCYLHTHFYYCRHPICASQKESTHAHKMWYWDCILLLLYIVNWIINNVYWGKFETFSVHIYVWTYLPASVFCKNFVWICCMWWKIFFVNIKLDVILGDKHRIRRRRRQQHQQWQWQQAYVYICTYICKNPEAI